MGLISCVARLEMVDLGHLISFRVVYFNAQVDQATYKRTTF